MADFKSLSDLTQVNTDFQSGDRLFWERAGAPDFRTYAQLQASVALADGAVTTAKLADDAVTRAKIADAAMSGADATLITGTAGTAGNLAEWNADGDVVDGPDVLDEDDMASDSATAVPTQQSVKAYVGAQGGAGMEFIETFDASSSANLDFTGFDATKYDAYLFALSNVTPATNAAVLFMRTSSDGGSTFDSGSGDYSWALIFTDSSGTTPAGRGSLGDDEIELSASGVRNQADEGGYSGEVRVLGAHLAKFTQVSFSGFHAYSATIATNYATINGGGARESAADVDAVRFFFSSGNIASGTITLYGLRNA